LAAALADVVPLAIAVALSPVGVSVFLLMLLSEHEIENARAYALGWAATFSVIAIGALLTGVSFKATHPPTAVRLLEVGAGVVVIAAAVFILTRLSAGHLRRSRWLAITDGISAWRAGVLGVLFALINPKDVALSVGAGATVSDAPLSGAQSALAIAVFAAVATVTITVPLTVALLAGERAQPTLRAWHDWLDRNAPAVTSALLAVAGVLLIVDGLRSA
jgi:hypothetical protein